MAKPDPTSESNFDFEQFVKEVRPELHRYCAHMMGSVIEGEDVLQDTLTKAFESFSALPKKDNIRGWLFRIAHNKAIDTLRKYETKFVEPLDDDLPLTAEERPLEDSEIVSMAMRLFLELTPKQRGCVLLKDVMSYSLSETSEILEMNVNSVKAALHRGRTRLRELSKRKTPAPSKTPSTRENGFLKQYVDSFNARDFDTLRAMLAADVRCELVGINEFNGAEKVSGYYGNYNSKDDWRLVRGFVETTPAILVFDPRSESTKPVYFMLVEEENSQIIFIRDFRYARYVMNSAEIFDA